MFKKALATVLVAGCVCSLAACAPDKPTIDEVAQAISAGTLTVEDALEKGWVDQTWADDYLAERAAPAADKVALNAVGPFETAAADGTSFACDRIEGPVLLVFMDPAADEAEQAYGDLVKAYQEVRDAGADILLFVKGEDLSPYAAAPFTVLAYNDSVQAALGKNSEMATEIPVIAAWCAQGSILSAWTSSFETESLARDALAFSEAGFGTQSANGNTGAEGPAAADAPGDVQAAATM